MVKAVGLKLIDRGFESGPSHIFFFFLLQKEQKI